MTRLLTMLVVCCAFAQDQSATRDLPLPEGVSGARCVSQDGRAYSSPPSGRTLRVNCGEAPETALRCDFEGAEPLDVTLAALCAAARVPATRASRVVIRAPRPAKLIVEWLRFVAPPDIGVHVVARRALGLDKAGHLSVGIRDDRFITFRRPGASPITVRADALASPEGWMLPDAAPGGELVARVSPAPITAIKYHLMGAASAETTPDRHVAAFRAVPAGAYQLVPEYEGGLQGTRTQVAIEKGESTFVALPEERLGGVHVITDAPLCNAAVTLAISRIRSAPRGVSSAETVLTLPASPECVQTIAGLRPGEYQASLSGKDGRLAVQPFEVAAQVLTALSLTADPVRVSGGVTLNGHPLPNVSITFVAPAHALTTAVGRTDANGFYDLTLPAPGRFQVWFQRDGFTMLGNEREVTLSAGANSYDWDLHGGTLRVTVKGWARSVPIDIRVVPLLMSKPGKVGDVVRLLPTGTHPVVFSGLNFGRYAVQASEHQDPPAQRRRLAGATVTIEEGRPETEVELELTDSRGVVRIVDNGGGPVSDATVKVGEDDLAETAPGVFSLANVPPATYVRVDAAGYTPVLRLVPSESPFDVVLSRGIQVRLHFVGGNPPLIKGSLAWPGTDSPVPLQRLAVTRSADGTGDFIVHNFPADPTVVYIAGPFEPPELHQVVRPDAHGVVHIR